MESAMLKCNTVLMRLK